MNFLFAVAQGSKFLGVIDTMAVPPQCPACGGEIQALGMEDCFCLYCDWDNMGWRRELAQLDEGEK